MQRPVITAEWEERHARNVEKLQKRREEYARLRRAAQATPAQGEMPLDVTEPTREQDAHQRSHQPTWDQPNNPPEQTVPQPVITADERPSVGEGAGVSTPAGELADSHNRQPGDGVRVSFNGERADADQLYEDRAAEAENHSELCFLWKPAGGYETGENWV